MSNASTIRRQIAGTQQLTLAPLSGTIITTTETAFQLNNNGLTLTGGGYIPLSAGVTGLYAGTGQVIAVHIAGTVTGGTAASTSLIIKLYQVPAAALPLPVSDSVANIVTAGATLIATSATGTLAAAKTSGNFSLDANLQLDANGNLTGDFTAQIFASTTGVSGGATQAATTQAVLSAGEADLNFLVSATLGGTEAGVIVTLEEFALALV
jgi:hypothetical protein